MQVKLTGQKIWLASESVDFRKSVNGLSALVVEHMNRQPSSGIFVFYNKGRNRLKILGWHGNGFLLVYKRLERRRFLVNKKIDKQTELTEQQLEWLLAGLDWELLSNWDRPSFELFV